MHPISLRAMVSASAMALALSVSLHAQTNIEFVGQLSYDQLRNSDLSNLWGYTDEEGNEYAIMGVNGNNTGDPGGVSVVDLSDPANPVEIYFFEGPTSIWREIKVWEDHAYITTEAGNGGLTIVDLSPLPQSTNLSSTVFFDPDWNTSHALFIDENGRLYIFGAGTGNGGAIMYDLTQDPMSPVRVGSYDALYIHDGYARGDTMYAGHIQNGFFSIVDVSDPAAPVLLGTQITPNSFTHNVWLDDSGDHIYTTDERTSSYVGSYDISDPTDIQFLDKLQSDPGSGAIPHNTYWLPSQHVVTSYYTYGVAVYDVSRPDNMVEVGHYDTSPISGGGFFGAWGVYPFFSSGRLIISDIEQGLFVLDPTYVRACWLEGAITSSGSGTAVSQANIAIQGTDAFDVTSLDGLYGTGYVTAGTYSVTVSAPGYFPTTVSGVQLENGVVTLLDIQLDPLPSFPVEGIVRTMGTSTPIGGAAVRLISGEYTFTTTTDGNGSFSFPAVFNGEYSLLAGRWGWHTACPPVLTISNAGSTGLIIEMEAGYADDFAMDLGWQVSSTASRGGWVRGVPAGTNFQGAASNPGMDVTNDCRDNAYVTGNGGGSAGSDDVDEGGTLLTSPVFDIAGMDEAHVRFQSWFFNAGGDSSVNDAMVFSLTNGADTVAIRTLTSSNSTMSQWRFNNIRIADHMEPSSTMRFLAYIADDEPGHIVEGGLDVFSIVADATTGLGIHSNGAGMSVWPNPTNSMVNVRVANGTGATVSIMDALGRVVLANQRMHADQVSLTLGLPAGSYYVKATMAEGSVLVQRLVITD